MTNLVYFVVAAVGQQDKRVTQTTKKKEREVGHPEITEQPQLCPSRVRDQEPDPLTNDMHWADRAIKTTLLCQGLPQNTQIGVLGHPLVPLGPPISPFCVYEYNFGAKGA